MRSLFNFNAPSATILRNIKLIVFILPVLGLLCEAMAFIELDLSEPNTAILLFKSFFSTLNLTFFTARFLEYSHDGGFHLSFLDTGFYLLLLTGAFLYVFSKGKEMRLIRFVLSVILISNAIYFVIGLANQVFYFSEISQHPYWWLYFLVRCARNLLAVYFSFYVLLYFNRTRTLQAEVQLIDGHEYLKSEEATKWQRFFHLITDTFVSIFIFSQLIAIVPREYIYELTKIAGERAVLYILLIFIRFIYYPFFESILGATPAKFLSETRVVDEKANRPSFGKAVLRTLSRYIPFEPFSFFGAAGWHDNLTKTQVVKEVRTGVNGGRYFLIIPIVIVLVFSIYFAHEKYEHHQSYLYSKNQYDEKIAGIEKCLAKPDTADLLEIEDILDPYSNVNFFLKVESADKEHINFTLITRPEDYSHSLLRIEKLYRSGIDSMAQFKIKRSDLETAYTKDFDESEKEGRKGYYLFRDGRKFEIKQAWKLFCPVILDRHTGSYGTSLSMEFCNYGWPAKIISLEMLEGSINWANELPYPFPSVENNDYPSTSLQGYEYKTGQHYKFKMVLLDSMNRKHNYIIEGKNLEKTINKID